MSTLERLREGLAGLEYRELEVLDGLPTLEVSPGTEHPLLQALRDRCGFQSVTFVTAVDYFPEEPRFRVVWQLLSVRHNDRVRVQCRVPGGDPRVRTITDLWPGASYSEREAWDLFGIRFEGHPDLRRLMMPEAYDHHPLRKDFPHQGIEPDRLYREWDRSRRVQGAGPA